MFSRIVCFFAGIILCLAPRQSIAQITNDSLAKAGFPNYDMHVTFPGGQGALNNFIAANLKSINGAAGKRLIASFIIEKDGTVTHIKIVRGINAKADKEAIRVINLFPKWEISAPQGPVHRVAYSIPIWFK